MGPLYVPVIMKVAQVKNKKNKFIAHFASHLRKLR